MKNICVITGGGSGMGYSVAKLLPNDLHLIICGRTVAKLEGAVAELQAMGKSVEAFACDVSVRADVEKLAEYAASQGTVTKVMNAAGISTMMGSGEKIIDVNVNGAINVVEVFGEILGENTVILNVGSSSAYTCPEEFKPHGLFQLVDTDREMMMKKLKEKAQMYPGDQSYSDFGYMYSKMFVIWYSKYAAHKYGKKGIRILSVTPGTILTPMGELEGERALELSNMCALGGRPGSADEIGEVMVFLLSDKASYMAGVDIKCDGGANSAFELKMDSAARFDVVQPISYIKQIGIITDDLEKSMAQFEALGIGGWGDINNVPAETLFDEMWCYDKPQFYNIKSVTTNALNIELELIQPLDDYSDYAAFLKKNGGPGMHHISVFTNNMEGVESMNKTLVVAGSLKGYGFGYKYYDFQDELGMILEYMPTYF